MRKRAIIGLLGLAFAMAGLQAQNWTLVWADEFQGDALDTDKWSFMIGDGTDYGIPGWGNNELQYYREENVTVSNGKLHITARKEPFGGKAYTSGRIRSLDKGDWKYCRVKFLARMPKGQGMWAAVWMLPTDTDYGGWAASGELDIMEYVGKEPSRIYGTLHFGGEWPANQQKGTYFETDGWPFYQEFHEFVMEWVEGEIRWYIDGELYQTQGQGDWNSSAAPFPAPFDQRFHLLINLAVGGNWPGSPDGTTEFPQELTLEYIRVYEEGGTGIGDLDEEQNGFRLEQNHPNPFSGQTTIAFNIPNADHVLLELYDSTGRRVRTLADHSFEPGMHRVELESGGLTPGLYSYRLKTTKGSSSRQMLIL
ncbi:MAG: glycosyl hydrolase family protein [Bacteroidia bacterium]|nr:MAG: glycosyl hydrolase family protein [Bacteroidia bacterium]